MKIINRRLIGAILLCMVSLSVLGQTFIVISQNFDGPGTLRDLIAKANSNPGADIIQIPAGIGEIYPGLGQQVFNNDGSLYVKEDLTIIGLGSNPSIINDRYTWVTSSGHVNAGYACDTGATLVADSNIFLRVPASTTPINLVLENITVTDTAGLISGHDVNLTLNKVNVRNNNPRFFGSCDNGAISLGGDSSLTIIDSYFFNNKGPGGSLGFNFIIEGDLLIDNSSFFANNVGGADLSYMLYVAGTNGNNAEVEIKDSNFLSLTNSPIAFINADVNIANSLFDGPLSGDRSGFFTKDSDLTIINTTMIFSNRTKDPLQTYYEFPASHLSMEGGALELINSALLIPFNGKSDFPIKQLTNTTLLSDVNNYESDATKPDGSNFLPSYLCGGGLTCFVPHINSFIVDGGDTASAVYKDQTDIIHDQLGTDRSADSAIDIGAFELPQTYAHDDQYSLDENTTLSIAANGVLANDNMVSTSTLKTDVAHGTLALNSDGSFDYTPQTDFYGTDSFEYYLDLDTSKTATVNIIVSHVQQTPVSRDDHYNVYIDVTSNQGSPGVLSNDSDADNIGQRVLPMYGLSAVLVTDVTYGTLVLRADGSFDYTPSNTATPTTPAVLEKDSFTYYAVDAQGNTGNAVTVTLQQILPAKAKGVVANDDHYAINEGQILNDSTVNLLNNDHLVPGYGYTFTAVIDQSPTNGGVTINSDGTFVYIPNTGYTGDDTFTYTLFDGLQSYNPEAAVIITVTAVPVTPPANNPPTGTDDNYTVNLGSQMSVATKGVLTNDIDADNRPPDLPNAGLTAVLATNPTKGILILNSDGSFDYTSTGSTVGTDSFTYYAQDANSNQSNIITVTINLTQPAAQNVVLNADHYNMHKGDTLTTTTANGVIANDQFSLALSLTAVIDKQPKHGTLTFASDGTFIYTPSTSYTGDDSFSYYLTDGTNYYVPHAVVTISVVDNGSVVSTTINPHSDHYCSASSALDVDAGYGILSNDNNSANTSGNLSAGLSAALSTDVTNGTLILQTDGSFNYASNSGFVGQDSFTYSVTSTQGASSRADTIVSLVVDPYGCGTSLHLTAVDDAFTTNINQRYDNPKFNLLGNDSLNGQNGVQTGMTTKLVRSPTHGAAAVNSDGTIEYVPGKDFTGKDTFTYIFELNSQHSNTAKVEIYVLNTNQAPIAVDDHFIVYESQSNKVKAAGVLSNDLDPDTSSNIGLSAKIVVAPTHGSLALDTDGGFTYIPTKGYTGIDSFSYEMMDSLNAFSNKANVVLTVRKALDSDGDGIPNHNEPGDQNQNGIPDAEEHQGAIQVAAKGGTMNLFAILSLLLLAGFRYLKSVRRLTSIIAVLFAFSANVNAGEADGLGWYLATELGLSRLSPDVKNNDWVLDDNKFNPAVGIGIGYQVTPALAVGFNYHWLNQYKVTPRNTNLDNASLKYSSANVDLTYRLVDLLGDHFTPYIIVGYNLLAVDVSGETRFVDDIKQNQVVYGAGFDVYRYKGNAISLEWRRFSHDAQFMGIRVQTMFNL